MENDFKLNLLPLHFSESQGSLFVVSEKIELAILGLFDFNQFHAFWNSPKEK